ncbi:MAG: accessory factor UbiK family protein [Gammaproteobacteria bacterium]|nr:accessory factor UbiK family protein [Gammaproteobacteria bacterium]
MALDPKILDDLAEKLADAVPDGVKHLRQDVEANFRAVLQSVLGKLDIVTREEFDVQSKVLERTREKLESINRRLADLEETIPQKRPRKKTKS